MSKSTTEINDMTVIQTYHKKMKNHELNLQNIITILYYIIQLYRLQHAGSSFKSTIKQKQTIF